VVGHPAIRRPPPAPKALEDTRDGPPSTVKENRRIYSCAAVPFQELRSNNGLVEWQLGPLTHGLGELGAITQKCESCLD